MKNGLKTIFFLVGNYGVGKSTLIKEPVINKDSIFLEIKPNLFVLGTDICGADSLSIFKKENVLNLIKTNTDKNIIIAGNYYCSIKDIQELHPYFKLVIIYLNTNYRTNKERIAKRGKEINAETYVSKLKAHKSLIEKTRGLRRLYIIDNNRPFNETKPQFDKIIADETN